MKETLISYFQGLKEKKFNYCVLRGYETLPDEVSNDIDLGLDPKELESFTSYTLSQLKINGFLLVHRSQKYLYRKLYFFNQESNEHLHVDIWTGFSFKGLKYINLHSLLDRKIQHKLFFIPSPSDELTLSFLKEYLHNQKIRKDKLSILQNLIKIGDGKEFDSYFNEKEAAMFKTWIGEGSVPKNANFKSHLKSLKKENRKAHGAFSILKEKLKYGITEAKGLLNGTGLFMVLIGPDGSGKTTTSNEIKTKIAKRFFSGMKYFHFWFGILPELSSFRKSKKASKLNKEEEKEEETNTAVTVSGGPLKRLVHVMYYLLDFIAGNVKMMKMRYYNDLVLFDRYYFDYFIHKDYKKTPRFLKVLYSKLSPKPDLIIFLNSDAQAIFDRKPELSVEEIKAQQNEIQLLLENKKLYKETVEIKTDKGLHTIEPQIRKAIYNILSKRYEHLYRKENLVAEKNHSVIG